jgi:hypothetical protein
MVVGGSSAELFGCTAAGVSDEEAADGTSTTGRGLGMATGSETLTPPEWHSRGQSPKRLNSSF